MARGEGEPVTRRVNGRRPGKQGLAFAVTFSHRGLEALGTFSEEAISVIEGVQPPEPEAARSQSTP